MGDKEISPTYTILKLGVISEPYFNFIVSKWMRSYRYGNDYIKLCDSDAYYEAYSRYIIHLLYRTETTVRLAVLSDDHDVFLGFSVIRGQTLDYVHVHKDCRRQGIGKRLVPQEINYFTHLTKIGMKLWPTKLPKAKFNPFA